MTLNGPVPIGLPSVKKGREAMSAPRGQRGGGEALGGQDADIGEVQQEDPRRRGEVEADGVIIHDSHPGEGLGRALLIVGPASEDRDVLEGREASERTISL